jgi:drug/metabolite transporter (DMT)-like permease
MKKKQITEVDEALTLADNKKISLKVALFVLFTALLWGGNGVSVKIGLQGIPPLALAGLRFGLGFLCIAGWILWTRTSIRIRPGEIYPFTIISFLFTIQICLLNIGLTKTLVSYSTLIFSLYPFFIALLANYFIPGDRLTRRHISGLLVAFLGIFVIVLGKLGGPTNQNIWFGNLLTLISSLCLSTQFVYTKRIIRGIDPIKLLFWQMIYCVPTFFLLSLFTERGISHYTITPKVIWALLYQGMVVAGFCFIGRNLLLKQYPASKLSAFFSTSPLFGVLLSILILHEPITLEILMGGSLVGVGIYLVNSK